jgi:hypothetical protein
VASNKPWRDGSATVWTTQAGYLGPAHTYLKWQLVDAHTRADEIQSMIETVRGIVLPAFDACSSMESLSTHLLARPEITRFPDWALDIALWVGNKQAAEGLIKIFLNPDPTWRPSSIRNINASARRLLLAKRQTATRRLCGFA